MPRPPNIVLILADDLGSGDLSCLNPDSKVRTPHHDRLAAEGLLCTDAHSCSSVCTPSRYGLLTGRYAWRSPLKRGVTYGYSPSLIEPGRPTLASFLSAAGYATALVGKWHLGLDYALQPGAVRDPATGNAPPDGIDWARPFTHGPNQLGFAHTHLLAASLDMPPYAFFTDGVADTAPSVVMPASPRPAFWRSGLAAPGFDHQQALHQLTTHAEDWLDARTGSDQPFFLFFSTPSPHTPHRARAAFTGASQLGPYGDLIAEHDASIGRILAALERNGQAENTLVIVTSDNGANDVDRGGAFDFARDFGHHANLAWRGQKSDAWEGGHRVPLLLRWPGRIAPGSTCDRTLCLTDLFATIAALLGQRAPAAAEDSVDASALLRGEARDVRDHLVMHSIDGRFAVRRGPWKLILCRGSGGWSLPETDVAADAPAVQLYHLGDDPGETVNRAREHPELVAELTRLSGVLGGPTAP